MNSTRRAQLTLGVCTLLCSSIMISMMTTTASANSSSVNDSDRIVSTFTNHRFHTGAISDSSNDTAADKPAQNQDSNTTDIRDWNMDTNITSSNSQNSNDNSTDSQSQNENFTSTYTDENSTSSTNQQQNQTQNTVENRNSLPPNDNSTDSNIDNSGQNPLQDFLISVDSNSTNIQLGEVRTYVVTISSLNGFNSSVSLSIPQSIPRVITAFSTSPLTIPFNSSSTSTLVIVVDPYAPTGRYYLTVNGTATVNGTTIFHSVPMKLELWKEQTLPPSPPPAPINVKVISPVPEQTGTNSTTLEYSGIKGLDGNSLDVNLKNKTLIMISNLISNNNNRTQSFVVIVEVIDSDEFIQSIQLQKGIISPLGEVEIGVSWMPQRSGIYHIRSFVIDDISDHPQPISASVEKTIDVR